MVHDLVVVEALIALGICLIVINLDVGLDVEVRRDIAQGGCDNRFLRIQWFRSSECHRSLVWTFGR